MRAFTLLGLLITCWPVLGCDLEEDETQGRSEPLTNARFVAEGSDPSVACVWLDDRFGCATGSVISPRLILTAAHNTVDQPTSNLWVYFGNDALLDPDPANWTAVIDYVQNPEADVALLVMNDTRTEAPLPMNAEPLEGREGESVRIVGFGISAPGAFDAYYKRTVTVPISHISTEPGRYEELLWPDTGMEFWMSPEGGTHALPGDSGAPVFGMLPSGEETILGVIWGQQDDSSSSASRVDTVRPWICEQMQRLDPACVDGSCCGEALSCVADGACDPACRDDPDCVVATHDAGTPTPDAGSEPAVDAGVAATDAAVTPTPPALPPPRERGCSTAPGPGDFPTWIGLGVLALTLGNRTRARP